MALPFIDDQKHVSKSVPLYIREDILQKNIANLKKEYYGGYILRKEKNKKTIYDVSIEFQSCPFVLKTGIIMHCFQITEGSFKEGYKWLVSILGEKNIQTIYDISNDAKYALALKNEDGKVKHFWEIAGSGNASNEDHIIDGKIIKYDIQQCQLSKEITDSIKEKYQNRSYITTNSIVEPIPPQIKYGLKEII